MARKGGRGLNDCVNEVFKGIEEYTKRSEERLITTTITRQTEN